MRDACNGDSTVDSRLIEEYRSIGQLNWVTELSSM
jgi:hypothetical protein